MFCDSCGKEVIKGAAFCQECGVRIPPSEPDRPAMPEKVTCPACQALNAPGSAFCESCGGALGEQEERRGSGLLGTFGKAAGAGGALGAAGMTAASKIGGTEGAAAGAEVMSGEGTATAGQAGLASAARSAGESVSESAHGIGRLGTGVGEGADAPGAPAGTPSGSGLTEPVRVGGQPGGPGTPVSEGVNVPGGAAGTPSEPGYGEPVRVGGQSGSSGAPVGDGVGASGGGAGTPGGPGLTEHVQVGGQPGGPGAAMGEGVVPPGSPTGTPAGTGFTEPVRVGGQSGSSGAPVGEGIGAPGGSAGTPAGPGLTEPVRVGGQPSGAGAPVGEGIGAPTSPTGVGVNEPVRVGGQAGGPGAPVGESVGPPGAPHGGPGPSRLGGQHVATPGVRAGPVPVGSAAGVKTGVSAMRIILIGLATLSGLVIGAIVMGAALIFTGSPKACADRTIPVSSAAAQQSRTLWNGFKTQTASGPASVTFSEEQVTSRGVEWVEEKDAPVKDLQVYLCPGGYGEATGKVSFLGRDIKVLVRGTLDVSGDKPVISIDRVEAGNLPSAVGTRIVSTILNTNNLKTLDLSVKPDSVTIADEAATLQKR